MADRESVQGLLSPGSFFGPALKSQEVSGFLLTESTYEPGHRVPAHAHERALFYLVLDGRSTDVADGRCRACTPGTLMYHPAGEPHSNLWEASGGTCFHIEVPPDRVEDLARRSALRSSEGYGGGLPVWLATRAHDEFRNPDPASRLAIEGMLLELIAHASRGENGSIRRGRPGWVARARELLLERCTEELTVSKVAAELHVHPTHFARAFRQAYSCSVGEFVRRARVERACNRLIAGRQSLSTLAYDLGFCDQSHFTRTFKREMGCTPSEFRQRFGTR
ncbi:MAG TPA: AraC family transcriptional regulator [Longimicrobium sp.]|jgi:AraC family transcriptional regulator